MIKSIKLSMLLLAAAMFLVSCSTLGLLDDARSSFDRGLALFNQGQYEAAIPHFRQATAENPDFAEAYLYLGRSYISLSRWREAIAPLRTAYRLAPETAKQEALNLLIDALFAAALNDFKAGDLGSSADFLREILRLDPGAVQARAELVKVLVTLGTRLLAEGSIAKAIDVYGEAVRLSPNNFDANLGLARSFYRNGDFMKALEALNEALRVNPGNREAEVLFKNLQKP